MAHIVSKYLDRAPVTAPKSARFSSDRIHTLAAAHGFRVVDFKIIGFQLSVDDLIGFYSIPFIGTRRFPNREPKELKALVTDRFQRLSEIEAPYYRWAQFVFSPE